MSPARLQTVEAGIPDDFQCAAIEERQVAIQSQ